MMNYLRPGLGRTINLPASWGLDVLQMTSMTCAGTQHGPYKASEPRSSARGLDDVLQTHNCKVIELQHPMVIV